MNDIVDMKIYVPDSKTLDDVFADLKAVKGSTRSTASSIDKGLNAVD
jgi:hypothetical protein